jgi:hypothetical protein
MKFFRIALAALPWLLWSGTAGADPISAIIVSIVGSVGVTVTASAVTGFLINTAVSVGLSLVAQMLTPKPKMQDPTFGADVTTRDSIAPRRLIYGTTKVAGTMVYIKATDNNYKHHYVIVLGQGPIDGVTTIYFNDEALTLDASGNVTSGAWAGNARIKVFTGEPTQAASSDLVAESGGEWTSNHRLQGIAYIYVRLNWTSALAAAGLPNISAVVRGLKVFDPRTSTTAYSANAALCFRHYLTLSRDQGGAGYTSPLGIDDTGNIIPQANICDENVALSGGGTEKRYECHGYFELDDSNTPQDRIQRFLTAMAGTMDPQAGQFRFYAGAWRGSVFSINESMMVGEFTVVRGESGARRYNAIKGAYLDPAVRYVAADYPAVTSTVFEAQDGGEQVFGELSLPMTTSPAMAQRIAKIALYRQRLGIRAEAIVSLEAFGVAVGDIVSVSFARYGFSAKQFEVTDREFKFQDAEIVIKLSLRETGSAVYDWSASEQQLVASSPATTLPNWSLVAPPSPLSYAEELIESRNSLGVKNQVTLNVAPSPDAFVNGYEFDIKLSADTAWVSSGVTSTTNWVFDDVPAGTYDFRVRARNVLGATSAYTTLTNKPIYSLTAAPSNPSGLAAQTAGGVIILTWDRSPDLDVRIGGQTIIRWTPLTTGVTWETTTSACEPVNGDATQALVPSRSGTYLIKFIDSSGIFSANYVSITADQASVIPYPNLTTAQEDSTFTGTKTNCVVASGALNLTTGQIDGTYLFAAGIDQTTVKTARLTAIIQALCYNSTDLFDSSELFDSAELFDGAGAADSDAWVEYRATNDNPSGSPVWGAWARVDASEVKARAFQFRARLTATNTNFNIAISQLRVKVETP